MTITCGQFTSEINKDTLLMDDTKFQMTKYVMTLELLDQNDTARRPHHQSQ